MVGIDLGTTFSVVALKAMDGHVSVIPEHVTGQQLLPSVVSFLDQETLVGHRALAERGREPQRTIFNAKRYMGKELGEVIQERSAYPYRAACK